MTNWFQYVLSFFNEYEGEEKTDYGFVVAETYADAAKILEDDYGDTIVDLALYPTATEGHSFSLPGDTDLKWFNSHGVYKLFLGKAD